MSEVINLGKNGSIYFHKNFSGNMTGSRIISDFLVDFFKNCANQSVRFHDAYGEDNPLRYYERNTYSLFGAAINSITPVHQSEVSISRKHEINLEEQTIEDTSTGRVDYWCYYRKRNILLEFKREVFGLKYEKIADRLSKKWDEMVGQVNLLKRDASEDYNDAIRTGILTTLPYAFHQNEEKLDVFDFDEDQMYERVQKMCEQFSLPPSYFAIWNLPHKMRYNSSYNYIREIEGTEINPAIVFFGYLDIDTSSNSIS